MFECWLSGLSAFWGKTVPYSGYRLWKLGRQDSCSRVQAGAKGLRPLRAGQHGHWGMSTLPLCGRMPRACQPTPFAADCLALKAGEHIYVHPPLLSLLTANTEGAVGFQTPTFPLDLSLHQHWLHRSCIKSSGCFRCDSIDWSFHSNCFYLKFEEPTFVTIFIPAAHFQSY